MTPQSRNLRLISTLQKIVDSRHTASRQIQESQEQLSEKWFLEKLLQALTSISNVSQITGPKGERGRDGYTPVKGIDYFTKKEAEAFLEAATPVKGRDYFDGEKGEDGKSIVGPKGDRGAPGKDGKDAEVDTEELRALAETRVKEHEQSFDHKLIHDPKILGEYELATETINEGDILQVQGKRIIGAKLPAGKKPTILGGGGATSKTKMVATVITSNTTLTSDHELVLIDASSGNITITLPDANAFDRWQFYLKRTDSSANTVSVVPTGSNTLDGQTTDQLPNQYSLRRYVSANDNWFLLAA